MTIYTHANAHLIAHSAHKYMATYSYAYMYTGSHSHMHMQICFCIDTYAHV